jgi:eukaryotic-like serine/threonine-protein kinase
MAVGVQAPARLGRYELLARLASGGMGEIFLARLEGAEGFEKLYAVKRVLPHLADDARFRAMLIAEARIASLLAHANICQVYELGESDGQLYIVMEYLEGITVLPMLRAASKAQTPLQLGLVAGVLQQAGDALHYAHELGDRGGESLGIVHRDVTPSNVFLTEAGVVKVLDFGIAKVKDASAKTQTGTIKGKYAYMAPEQLRGAGVDRRADVFALAVVTFEMLALRRLFQRKTDYLTFRAVMEQPIPDLRSYRPEVPEALAIHLARGLERDLTSRFESVRAFVTAVVEAIAPVQRPWTQGEIADFVRADFGADIARQREEIAAAIGRARSGRLLTVVPVLAPDDDDGEEDREFPPVESAIESGEHAAQARELDAQTPPPFDTEASASGPVLQPLTGVAPPPRRGLLWPIVAAVMVAITSIALYLVWRQTQQAAPVVNITSEPRLPEPEAPEAPVNEVEPAGSSKPAPPPASSTKRPTGRQPAAKPPRRSPYTEAVQAHATQITRCAREHGRPPSDARVVIIVATTGKARQVTLEPAALDASALGACIRRILVGARYPTAAAEMRVTVPIKS